MDKKGWELKIGQGVIDCAFSASTKKIVAGDVNGLTIVTNYNGEVIQEFKHEMPVWGVDISDDGNTIAIGLASKQPLKGAFVIEKYGKEFFRHDTDVPVWDVKFVRDIVVVTTWGEGLYLFSLSTKELLRLETVEEHLFGIYLGNDDNVYVVSASKGIYSINVRTREIQNISKNPHGSYNIVLLSSLNTLFYGSTNNLLCSLKIDTKTEKNYRTITDSICGLAEYKNLLIYGDLHGNFFISHMSLPSAPLFYSTFPGSIWHIAVDSSEEVAFIACGDGILYCIDIPNTFSLSKSWDIEKIPIDLSIIQGAKVFISYASEDKETAELLYNNLKQIKCSPWMDRHNLLPGQIWKKEIKKSMENCEFFIVCLSSNSVSKQGYIQREIKKALDILEEIPDGQIFLLPVRLDECEVPDSFSEWQWVDLFSDDGFYKLVLAIHTEMLRKLEASASKK